ncbi:MAG: hypothetical protein R2795_06600 [Saprospiraceae bacterium]
MEMKIIDLIQAYRTTPVFSTKDIEKKFAGFESENLLNWQSVLFIPEIIKQADLG